MLSEDRPPNLGPCRSVEILLTPTEKGEEPRIELVGIGAALSAKDDALVIGKVFPGGGAAEVGLAEGDRVVRVDGEPVSQLGFASAVQKVRGPEGTTVTLVVVKSGQGEVSLVVPRRSIKNCRRRPA
jgi:C-terminal processing protease CtpA/Prc